jgi:hypothetical protein
MYLENVRSHKKCALDKPHLISDFRMITFVFSLSNASGLVCAKNLRKWAEKAFASSTLVFHALTLPLELVQPKSFVRTVFTLRPFFLSRTSKVKV